MAAEDGPPPASVLFACARNAVRSPIAEALTKRLYGQRIYVDSVGVRPGKLDPFAVAALQEIGIDLTRHRPKGFEDLEDTYYDLIISLTPEAQHQAVEMTRTMACDLEYWPTLDPTAVYGSREQKMDAYRELRDSLERRIIARFGAARGPQV
jgi:protein-tyrosine-phosphatase